MTAARTKYGSRCDIGPCSFVPLAMGMAYCVAHPIAGLYGRPRVIHRRARRSLFFHWLGNLAPHIRILDQDLCRLVRDGRRLWHHDAFPIWHELEPFH